jgi:hypothetical protein
MDWNLRACLSMWATFSLLGGMPAAAAERTLDKEIVVAASLDATWNVWTTREGIVSFFAPDAAVSDLH